MMDDYKHTIAVAIIFVLVVISGIWQCVRWHDCSVHGGDYVKTMGGFYKCIGEDK
jgi:hypothetical protein